MTTAWALAQENDRAPRRLDSPREAGENQDRELRPENQGPRTDKAERREAKRMAKRQGRGEFAPMPPGRGMGGPGYHGGQDFRPPGRGPGFNQPPGNDWGAGQHPEICPECKRPLGPMSDRGPGMGQPGPRSGGPGFGPNRQSGRGMMGPYARNNQRPSGPRGGMGPMNRPPVDGDGQFGWSPRFGGQNRGPAMRPRGEAPGRQQPMFRGEDFRPSFRDQAGPRHRPNADRDLRDQDNPRPEQGNPNRSRPDNREE